MSKSDNRTATERLEDLEKVVTVLYQAASQNKSLIESLLENFQKTQGENALIKDTLRILNKKLEAVIQVATPETGVTPESVSNLLTKMNVEDLTNQVAQYVTNGQIAVSDTVAANSFLVCEEYDADGKLVNPRIQFRMDSQDANTNAALTGKKVGETVSFGENKFAAKILEIYALVTPEKEPEATAPAEATPEAKEPEATAGYTPPAFTGPDTTPTESPVTTFVSDAGTTTSDTATA